jgi:hypothetical protein
MEVLPSFMTPAPSVIVCGKSFPNSGEAIDALGRLFAEDYSLAYVTRERENIIARGGTDAEREILGGAVRQAINLLQSKELVSKQERGEVLAFESAPGALDGGYAGLKKVETEPTDWVWMAAKSESGAVYINLDEPWYEFKASVINSRIPSKHWPIQRDAQGQPKRNRLTGELMRNAPSIAHLSYDTLRVVNVTMNPWNPDTVYVNDLGERVLNQYRAIKLPPRPEAKYFEIVPIIKALLKQNWPGREEYILDHFKHMLCSLESKASTHLVLGGGQGIGKNVLLSLFTYVQNRQGKVSVVEKHQLTMDHTDYLMRPILIVDEFELPRSSASYSLVKERLKAWTGSADKWLAVHPKGRPATQVANIHRVIITTNNPHQIPRDNDDRRYAIMNSSATQADFHALMRPKLAALGYDLTGPSFSFNRMWEEGYGDAFAHFLMDRDYSDGFNPNLLPRDLLDQYDENTRGFNIPESMSLALDEIALTFEKFVWERNWHTPMIAWPDDIEDVTKKHWPTFVTAKQLKGTHSAFFSEVDGERLRTSTNLDTLARNAGYVLLTTGDDKTQWRGPLPKKDAADGAVRVESKLYVRADAFPNGTTMESKRAAAREFVLRLTDFWSTADGVESFWTVERVKGF